MRLLRVECHGFGKLVDAAAAFGPGLSLVLGRNEAGKSTLVDSIMAGLYGLKGRSAFLRHLRDLRLPWQPGTSYAVTLTLATGQGGGELLVHRDFTAGQVQAWRKSHAGLLPVDESELTALLASLGAPSLTLFTSTFLVRQAEVAALDRQTLGQALVEKITAGEEAVTAREARQRLERRRQELVRGGDRQPGLLTQANERLRRWQDTLGRTAHRADLYYQALAESQALAARRQAAAIELARLEPLVNGYRQLRAIEADLDQHRHDLEKEAGRLAEYRRSEHRLAAVDQELDRMTAVNRYEAWRRRTGETLEDLARSLESLDQQLTAVRQTACDREEKRAQTAARLQDLREELGRLDPQGRGVAVLVRAEELARDRDEQLHQAEERGAQAESLAPRVRLANWCFRGFLITLAAAGWLAYTWLGGRPALAGGALGAVALAGLLLGGYLRTMGEIRHRDLLLAEAAHFRRVAAEIGTRLSALTGGDSLDDLRERARQAATVGERIADLERSHGALTLALEMSGLAALEETFTARRRQAEALLEATGLASLEEARQLLARHRELTAAREVLRAEMAGRLGQDQPEDLRRRADALAGTVATLEARRDALRQEVQVELKPHEFAAYAARQEELAGELRATDAEAGRLEERIRVLRADLMEGDPWELAARIDAETQVIDQLEREALALGYACQALEEAAAEIQRLVAPALQDRAGELLAAFTAGRYREIELEVLEGELRVRVRSPETGQLVGDEALSAGTRDQLYLALRVALAEHLAGGHDFPLILDDPFVHYDPDRLAAAAAALAGLASERQIIWVSKDDQLPGLLPGANVLRL